MEKYNIKSINRILYEELKQRIEMHANDLLLYFKKNDNDKTLYIIINYFYKNNSYITFYDENKKIIYNKILLEKYNNVEIICNHIFNKKFKFNIIFETSKFISCLKEFKDIKTIEKMLLISKIKPSKYIFKNTVINKLLLYETPFIPLFKYIKYSDKDDNIFSIYPIKKLINISVR